MNLFALRQAYIEYCTENKGAFYITSSTNTIKIASTSCYWSTEEQDNKILDVEDFVKLASPEQLKPIFIKCAINSLENGQVRVIVDTNDNNKLKWFDNTLPKGYQLLKDKPNFEIGANPYVGDVEDAEGEFLDVNDPVKVVSDFLISPKGSDKASIEKGVIRGWALAPDYDADKIVKQIKKQPLFSSPEEIESTLRDQLAENTELLSKEISDPKTKEKITIVDYDEEYIEPIRSLIRNKLKKLFLDGLLKQHKNHTSTWTLVDQPNKENLNFIGIPPYINSNLFESTLAHVLKGKNLEEDSTITRIRLELSKATYASLDEEELEPIIENILEKEGINEYVVPWALVELLDDQGNPTGKLRSIIYSNLIKDTNNTLNYSKDSDKDLLQRALEVSDTDKGHRGRPANKKEPKDFVELSQEELLASNNPEIIEVIKELKAAVQYKESLESDIEKLNTQLQTSLFNNENKNEIEKLEVDISNKGIQLKQVNTKINELQKKKKSVERSLSSKITSNELLPSDDLLEEDDSEGVLRANTQDALFESQVNDFQLGLGKHQYKTDYAYRNPDESLADLNISPKSVPFTEKVKYTPETITQDTVEQTQEKPNKKKKVIDMIMNAEDKIYKELTRKEAILLDLYIRVASAIREDTDINVEDMNLNALDNANSTALDNTNSNNIFNLDTSTLDPLLDNDDTISGELDGEDLDLLSNEQI